MEPLRAVTPNSLFGALYDDEHTDTRYAWPQEYAWRQSSKYRAEDRHIATNPFRSNLTPSLDEYLNNPRETRDLIDTFIELESGPDPPDHFHFAPLKRFLENGCLIQLQGLGQKCPDAVVILDQRYDDTVDPSDPNNAHKTRNYDDDGPGSYLDEAPEGGSVEFYEFTVAELFRKLFEPVSRDRIAHAPETELIVANYQRLQTNKRAEKRTVLVMHLELWAKSNRCYRYMTNPTPNGMLALTATVGRRSASCLRSFFQRYISRQPYLAAVPTVWHLPCQK